MYQRYYAKGSAATHPIVKRDDLLTMLQKQIKDAMFDWMDSQLTTTIEASQVLSTIQQLPLTALGDAQNMYYILQGIQGFARERLIARLLVVPMGKAIRQGVAGLMICNYFKNHYVGINFDDERLVKRLLVKMIPVKLHQEEA